MRGEFNKQLYHCSIRYYSSVAKSTVFQRNVATFILLPQVVLLVLLDFDKRRNPLEGGFDPLETKWNSFEYQLGWFCYAYLATLYFSTNHTCSLKRGHVNEYSQVKQWYFACRISL